MNTVVNERAAGALLETQGLCKSFGALEVARNIDFRLEAGARHALIGPNGAGKPTFVNLLTGVLLIVVVLFARGGVLGIVDQLRNKWLSLSKPKSSARASAR